MASAGCTYQASLLQVRWTITPHAEFHSAMQSVALSSCLATLWFLFLNSDFNFDLTNVSNVSLVKQTMKYFNECQRWVRKEPDDLMTNLLYGALVAPERHLDVIE